MAYRPAFRDRSFDSTITKGSQDTEVMLPIWTTSMCGDLCDTFQIPASLGICIRRGVEEVYQSLNLGDDHIPGSGCVPQLDEAEKLSRDNILTDYGRIKHISTAEPSFIPVVLTVYLLAANRVCGLKLNGPSYKSHRETATAYLKDWYCKHATGAPLQGRSDLFILGELDRLMQKPMGTWQSMQWYRGLPLELSKGATSSGEPPRQPLQERNANTAPPQDPSPNGKKRSHDESSKDDERASPPKSAKKPKGKDGDVPSPEDLSDIHLEGEETEEVPIFDTCDDIRKKINEALNHTSQPKLAELLSAYLSKSDWNVRYLRRFLKASGPQGGAHNPFFYAAYVYFEKRRIKDDKKKTAKREKMEKIWRKPQLDGSWRASGSRLGGFPREGDHNRYLTLVGGRKWKMTQYGEINIVNLGSYGRGRIERKPRAKG